MKDEQYIFLDLNIQYVCSRSCCITYDQKPSNVTSLFGVTNTLEESICRESSNDITFGVPCAPQSPPYSAAGPSSSLNIDANIEQNMSIVKKVEASMPMLLRAFGHDGPDFVFDYDVFWLKFWQGNSLHLPTNKDSTTQYCQHRTMCQHRQ